MLTAACDMAGIIVGACGCCMKELAGSWLMPCMKEQAGCEMTLP